MTLEQVMRDAIRPALALLPAAMDTPQARCMLLAIGLQESRFVHRRQIGGPARGFWQFEQGGGVRGVLAHPAARRWRARYARFAGCRRRRRPCTRAWNWTMCWRPRLRGCCWTDPARLPRTGDADAAWALYLRTWRPGKPIARPGTRCMPRRRKRPRSWNMLESWVKRSLGWMAALLAGLAAVAGVYGGAGPGREQERADTEARLQARAVQARRRWNMCVRTWLAAMTMPWLLGSSLAGCAAVPRPALNIATMPGRSILEPRPRSMPRRPV